MPFSSPTLTQDVAGYNDRMGADLADLPEGDERARAERTFAEDRAIAGRFDARINDIQSRWEVARRGQLDPAKVKAIAATHKAEIFVAIERASTDIAHVDHAIRADEAAHATLLDHVGAGRLVLDMKSGGATLTKAVVPTSDELRALQQERAALRELPQDVVEEQYLNAVNRADNPRLVTVVESAPDSLPLVRDHARERARQIRVANFSRRLTPTQKSLALRKFSHGHASRAIQQRIAALKKHL